MKRHQLGAAAAVAAIASLAAVGAISTGSDRAERSPRQTVGATTSNVTVMTWNICGEASDCVARNNPEGQANQLADLVAAKGADAVLLQEICGDEYKNNSAYDPGKTATKGLLTHVREKLGTTWTVAFLPYDRPAQDRYGTSVEVSPGLTREYPPRKLNNAPATSNFRCRSATIPGVQGMAVAVKGSLGERSEYELASPVAGLWLKALCVRRTTGTPVRFCTTHLTPEGEDRDRRAGFSYRAAQLQRITEIVGAGPDTVFGGDLNTMPPDGTASWDRPILVPLYNKYRECQQLNGTKRGGVSTKWPDEATHVRQYDYLFAKNSFTSCEVVGSTQAWSDHKPVVGTVSVTTP